MSTMDADLKEFLDSTSNDMVTNLFILEWMAKRLERNHEVSGVQSKITKMSYDLIDKNLRLDVQIIPPRILDYINVKLTV